MNGAECFDSGLAKTTGSRMQHAVGADFKVPLPMFSGRNDYWPVWSARFGAYPELAGWTAVLEVAEAQTAPISMVGASLDAMSIGKYQLFISRQKEQERTLGGFYTQNTRDFLEHVWKI